MTLDISAAFTPASIDDHDAHEPNGAEWFQESALFTICDPVADVFGYCRIGIHPALGVANAYSFISVPPLGIVERRFEHGHALPGTPVTNCQLDGMRFEPVDPMRDYRVTVERAEFRLSVRWQPFFWPISVHSSVRGASFATGHYNAIGRATGTVQAAGRTVAIDAYGYMDHSWGERKSHFPASKWIFACSGEDSFVQAFPVLSPDGQTRSIIGYAARDGRLCKLVGDYTTGYALREDWLTPSACDAVLRDEDGRIFHLVGTTQGPESLYPFLHGKFCVHALARFTLDGRAAKGLLENSPPRAILPGYVDRYRLDAGGMWLRPPGELVPPRMR